MKSGIYCIKNNANNKIYVGSSKNMSFRWSKHKYRLNVLTHGNSHLQKAWNKYGKDTFTFLVIEYCEISMLENKEKFWILKLDALNRNKGYNIRPGADRSEFTDVHRNNISKGLKNYYKDNPHHSIGKSRSPEVKKKISESNIGKKISEETRRKISLHNKNRGQDWRDKLSISHMGHTQSESTKNKIGLASKELWNKEKQKPKKQLICEICDEEYFTNGRRSKYCSGACCSIAYRRRKKNNL